MQPPPGTQESAITREMPPVAVGDANPLPPAPVLASPPGEACSKCGAAVAADQRYCIECGERQGDPRLPFMDGRTAAQAPADAPQQPAYPAGYAAPPAPPKGKWSSGLALLSTIAVLLLAMGVGVLIGNKGDKASSQQPLVVGGVGATSATAGATGATAEASSSGGKDGGASTAAADGTTDSGVDADALAKKNGVKLAPKDVDLGGKCEKGSVGCSDSGTFDGDYFK